MTNLVSVIEADSYLAAAGKLLTEAERSAIVDMIAADPSTAGVIIPGTGGLRKMRVGLQGRGKRGGGRVIYWFHSPGHPAALLWVFAKNTTTDLTKDQYRKLSAAMDGLLDDFGVKR